MSVKRRRFTSQFKAKVAMEALKGQRTIGELAGVYQVHPSQIAAWKKRLVDFSAKTFDDASAAASNRGGRRSIASLYGQIGQLQLEISWLKSKLELDDKSKMAGGKV
ncbi:MAG: transposase [Planctomycetes bacterium]|nr:transposase [Planctomycetota bacterium]MDA8375556.1 transposase [Planctomycetia bacterium]